MMMLRLYNVTYAHEYLLHQQGLDQFHLAIKT